MSAYATQGGHNYTEKKLQVVYLKLYNPKV